MTLTGSQLPGELIKDCIIDERLGDKGFRLRVLDIDATLALVQVRGGYLELARTSDHRIIRDFRCFEREIDESARLTLDGTCDAF